MILPVGYLPNNEHLKDNAFSMAFPGMMPTIYWYESMSLIESSYTTKSQGLGIHTAKLYISLHLA